MFLLPTPLLHFPSCGKEVMDLKRLHTTRCEGNILFDIFMSVLKHQSKLITEMCFNTSHSQKNIKKTSIISVPVLQLIKEHQTYKISILTNSIFLEIFWV